MFMTWRVILIGLYGFCLVLVEAQDNLPMKVWATWQATVWIPDTATRNDSHEPHRQQP